MSYAILNEYSYQTYSSADYIQYVDISNIGNLTDITILSSESSKYNLASSPSILLAARQIISIDFASRTSFSTSEVLDFDSPQYWIGA
jgi:hypothetical protein